MGALSYHQKTIQKEINGPVAVKNYMSTVNSLLQEHMEHGTIQNTNKPKDLFLNWLSVTDKKCLIHACRLIVSVLTVAPSGVYDHWDRALDTLIEYLCDWVWLGCLVGSLVE